MAIILASASPRRKELLRLITPDFEVVTSSVDESAVRADSPSGLALALACAKCEDVARTHFSDAVIGCDTVVEAGGKVLGKPRDKADARRMLQMYSGRSHLVHTGVCVQKAGLREKFTVTTRVTFCPMTRAEIEAYISTDEPYDKAGAYGIQGTAARFVCGVEGCYFNVMGLPVSRLYAALKSLGVRI